MFRWFVRRGPTDAHSPRESGRRWLPIRLSLYFAVFVALVVFRVVPNLRGRLPEPNLSAFDGTLELSGMSLAPDLLERLLDEYRSEYPKIKLVARPGGTTQALEDLVNRRTDIAFLARPPTAEEALVIRDRGDSVETFPIALAGIAVLASNESPIREIDLDALRHFIRGEGSAAVVYAPNPNRGLWDAVSARLGMEERAPVGVRWTENEVEVVERVAADRSALGLASTFALPDSLEERGVRQIPVRATSEGVAFTANKQEVANGQYPLFHHLYVSCRPGSGALASGFVTYLFGGRGQRLVTRAGYLPARDVPRLIQLTSKPIGGKGT